MLHATLWHSLTHRQRRKVDASRCIDRELFTHYDVSEQEPHKQNLRDVNPLQEHMFASGSSVSCIGLLTNFLYEIFKTVLRKMHSKTAVQTLLRDPAFGCSQIEKETDPHNCNCNQQFIHVIHKMRGAYSALALTIVFHHARKLSHQSLQREHHL
jgi:hypothetical protein